MSTNLKEHRTIKLNHIWFLAAEGHNMKLIRFGQQGVSGAGKNPKTAKDKARKKSYYARHNAQGKPHLPPVVQNG